MYVPAEISNHYSAWWAKSWFCTIFDIQWKIIFSFMNVRIRKINSIHWGGINRTLEAELERSRNRWPVLETETFTHAALPSNVVAFFMEVVICVRDPKTDFLGYLLWKFLSSEKLSEWCRVRLHVCMRLVIAWIIVLWPLTTFKYWHMDFFQLCQAKIKMKITLVLIHNLYFLIPNGDQCTGNYKQSQPEHTI